MAKRKQVNVSAWAKAHEAEAKRAERAAKVFAGDPVGEAWLTYAGRCRREAFDVLTREALPLECDLMPAQVEAVLPLAGDAWRDHLMALEAADALRFARARS
jgi:hypothetical protein